MTSAWCLWALVEAVCSAPWLMSMACTLDSGISRLSVMAIQPEPVPMSSIFCGACVSLLSLQMRSVSCSVSGRGIRVCGLTSKVREAKYALPVTYCSGSLWARR